MGRLYSLAGALEYGWELVIRKKKGFGGTKKLMRFWISNIFGVRANPMAFVHRTVLELMNLCVLNCYRSLLCRVILLRMEKEVTVMMMEVAKRNGNVHSALSRLFPVHP